jgi:hypothetical protein
MALSGHGSVTRSMSGIGANCRPPTLTSVVSGLALCHLLGPECEALGEIYSAAYNKLQAALIFAEMKAIVEAVPEFECRCNVQRYGKMIEVLSGDGAGSIYESLSADDKRAHGLAPSLWIMRRCWLPILYWKIQVRAPPARIRTPKPGRSSSKMMVSVLPSGSARAAIVF